MKVIRTIVFLFFVLFFCKTVEAQSNDKLILDYTQQVLTSLKKKDYKSFAGFIHPTLGVRFSAYSYVDTAEDVTFGLKEFGDQIKKENKFLWGNYDGTGDSIFMTINDYFAKFVYDADFLNAERRSVNSMIGHGNTLNNLTEVYKDCNFSESYFSGFDKKFEGMDWRALRLVFKKYNNKYYLVGIVHDQWTI